ncbi:MAG: DUF2157 domain-containing protein [Gammaproteobacteria bacterium]
MEKQDAQQRADRIHAFRSELDLLQREGILGLDADTLARVHRYHDGVLGELAEAYDIDVSSGQKQLSWGMRIAAFLGALAISAAVFFFFYRFWGLIGTPAQVVILIGAPVLAALATAWVVRRERSPYFVMLVALVAFTCFVLNLNVLGTIFNIIPSPNAFLAWAAFALVLAYGYGLRLLLVAGLISLMGFLAAKVGTYSGAYWLSFSERPENFLVAGLVIFALGFAPQRGRPAFAGIYRVFGLLVAFIAVLILANWGRISYLQLDHDTIENIYQTLGFAGAAATIWLGIARSWPGLTNLGSTFFVLFLYTKLFDWWWDWMPKYVFFLLVGLIAVAVVFALRRLRAFSQRPAP